jgi:hypothetical protein
MASLYYWWWAFLQRNTAYKRTCRQSGHGRLGWLYKDFGNVFANDFMSWWRSHQLLFAERNETANKETGIGVSYWLDPRKPSESNPRRDQSATSASAFTLNT